MVNDMFRSGPPSPFFTFGVVVFLLTGVVLATWKFFELGWWVFQHVHIGIK